MTHRVDIFPLFYQFFGLDDFHGMPLTHALTISALVLAVNLYAKKTLYDREDALGKGLTNGVDVSMDVDYLLLDPGRPCAR